MNSAGFLTINSQPAVDAAPSSHPVFGWGPRKGGFIFQKAYVEFFTAQDNLARIVKLCSERENLTYFAANAEDHFVTNCTSSRGTIAVTWGIFPGYEVVQPSIVDRGAFLLWKEEAFSKWTSEWGCLYQFGSPSRKIIEDLHDSYYLVCIVDNQYSESTLMSDLVHLLPGK